MNTKQVLIEARALLAAGWCQGPLAKDKNGKETNWSKNEAVSFCSLGAIYAASHKLCKNTDLLEAKVAKSCVAMSNPDIGRNGLAWWNERPQRTQTEVLVAFDTAISKL